MIFELIYRLRFYSLKHTRFSPLSIPIKYHYRTLYYLLLFVCRDISLNSGPVRNQCGKCSRPVAKNHRAMQREAYYYWYHIKCENISQFQYVSLGEDDEPWICRNYMNFQFSDSFFECFSEPNISIYQSPLILTELLQHDLINVSYLTACYIYQVMMTLHFLNDVANDAEAR